MITIYNIRPKGFNVGNDAIYVAMQPYLYQAFDGLINIITIPATSRYESHSIAGLTSKTIHEINQYGHGVIVGGGNLYENGELDVDLNALKALEVPLMLFSLSRGKIYNRRGLLVDRTDVMPDSVIKGLHARADYSLARDKATYKYIKDLGCDIQLGGCPTIFLNRLGDRIPNIDSIGSQYDNTALISIRNPNLINVAVTRQAKVGEEVKGLVSHLEKERGLEVKLLCHDLRDIAFASSLNCAEYIYTGDVYSYLSILQRCKLLISYRLHSFLPAISFGRQAIKISYDERAISLIDTLGMSDWNINMVESDNVIDDVIGRLDRIEDLEKYKESAQGRWAETDAVMTSSFEQFARDVNKIV